MQPARRTNETIELRKIVIEDFDLPVPVFASPYFEEVSEALEPFYHMEELFELAADWMKKLGSAERLRKVGTRAMNRMIGAIRKTPEFATLKPSNARLTAFLPKNLPFIIPEKPLYELENVGKKYVYVDLVEANFAAMRRADPALVLGAESYTELIARFSEVAYVRRSARIRHVAFSKLCPKMQTDVMRAMLTDVAATWVEAGAAALEGFEGIFKTSKDEIVAQFDASSSLDAVAPRLLDAARVCTDAAHMRFGTFTLGGVTARPAGAAPGAPGEVRVFTRVEAAPRSLATGDLRAADCARLGFDPHTGEKRIPSAGLCIKQCPRVYIPQVARHLLGRDPVQADRYFIHLCQLCRFERPLTFEPL
eukprot:gnl/Chilomastix_cuspidata/3589.p1 GENE.gnl/Chilomastix_cuspidata/3589~~gnl/Chilomastix_cuspidata/3589.p1  ORF type:complete len:365 (+),score=116.24 gnl/Chilomastix_cuspidata/3589:831-1925(+)